MASSKTDGPATAQRDSAYNVPGIPVLTKHVQATVLMSVDGAFDNQAGRSLRSHVGDPLDLGIRSIFLDLSGVDGVDVTGVCHLTETFDYASALGGGVVVLKASDALVAYLRDIEVTS